MVVVECNGDGKSDGGNGGGLSAEGAEGGATEASCAAAPVPTATAYFETTGGADLESGCASGDALVVVSKGAVGLSCCGKSMAGMLLEMIGGGGGGRAGGDAGSRVPRRVLLPSPSTSSRRGLGERGLFFPAPRPPLPLPPPVVGLAPLTSTTLAA